MKPLLRRRAGLPLLILAIMGAAFLLVACGGNDSTVTPTVEGSPTAVTPAPSTPTASAPTPEPRPTSEQLSTAEIAELLRPSVVRVQTEGAQLDIFGRAIPTQGVGTGVIIDEEGHIITNNHVLRIGDTTGPVADRIMVTLADGSTVPARVVGTDPPTDIGVIQIDASGLQPARLGEASALRVGDDVVALGYALGLEGGPTVTRGVVSAKERSIQEDPYTISDAIQTDASINPGNSGGPLVDTFGEVVGINTAIIASAQNIGFSISIDLVKPIAQELIDRGRIVRGFLGVSSVDITPAVAAQFALAVDHGVGITAVQRGGPADDAGLQANDIIVRIGDLDVNNNGDLLQALTEHRGGDTVTVQFYRGASLQETEVTLIDRPA
jgi:serine protease Do